MRKSEIVGDVESCDSVVEEVGVWGPGYCSFKLSVMLACHCTHFFPESQSQTNINIQIKTSLVLLLLPDMITLGI